MYTAWAIRDIRWSAPTVFTFARLIIAEGSCSILAERCELAFRTTQALTSPSLVAILNEVLGLVMLSQ